MTWGPNASVGEGVASTVVVAVVVAGKGEVRVGNWVLRHRCDGYTGVPYEASNSYRVVVLPYAEVVGIVAKTGNTAVVAGQGAAVGNWHAGTVRQVEAGTRGVHRVHRGWKHSHGSRIGSKSCHWAT